MNMYAKYSTDLKKHGNCSKGHGLYYKVPSKEFRYLLQILRRM